MSAFASLLTAILSMPPTPPRGSTAHGDGGLYDDGDLYAQAYGILDDDRDLRPVAIDYAPANAAAAALLRWGCGVARSRAPEPDDVAAIDRVEAYTRATFGSPGAFATVTPPDAADFLVTAAAMIEAFAIDFATPELTQLVGAAVSIADWWLRSAAEGPPPTGWKAAIGPIVSALRPRPRFVYGIEDAGPLVRNDNRPPAALRYAEVAR